MVDKKSLRNIIVCTPRLSWSRSFLDFPRGCSQEGTYPGDCRHQEHAENLPHRLLNAGMGHTPYTLNPKPQNEPWTFGLQKSVWFKP